MENLTSSPDISFVIAAFNAADTIEAAIQSALDQQGVTLEVIVVDDRSADDTIPYVEAIAAIDPRVRLLALEENRGPDTSQPWSAAADNASRRVAWASSESIS